MKTISERKCLRVPEFRGSNRECSVAISVAIGVRVLASNWKKEIWGRNHIIALTHSLVVFTFRQPTIVVVSGEFACVHITTEYIKTNLTGWK